MWENSQLSNNSCYSPSCSLICCSVLSCVSKCHSEYFSWYYGYYNLLLLSNSWPVWSSTHEPSCCIVFFFQINRQSLCWSNNSVLPTCCCSFNFWSEFSMPLDTRDTIRIRLERISLIFFSFWISLYLLW